MVLNIERLRTFFLLDIEQCGMRSSSVELAWLGSDRESKLLIIRIISLHWKSWPVLLSRCGMKYGLRWNGLSRYFFLQSLRMQNLARDLSQSWTNWLAKWFFTGQSTLPTGIPRSYMVPMAGEVWCFHRCCIALMFWSAMHNLLID